LLVESKLACGIDLRQSAVRWPAPTVFCRGFRVTELVWIAEVVTPPARAQGDKVSLYALDQEGRLRLARLTGDDEMLPLVIDAAVDDGDPGLALKKGCIELQAASKLCQRVGFGILRRLRRFGIGWFGGFEADPEWVA
jgi:hypothetical protein